MNQDKKLRRAIYVKICLLRKVTKSPENVTKSLQRSYEERGKSYEGEQKVTKSPPCALTDSRKKYEDSS